MHQRTIESVTLDDLRRIADRMVSMMPPQLAIGMIGTLGAGKTTMVQAIATAGRIDAADVTSPTFTLLQSHQGSKLKLHHLDAYRLGDEDEFYELGVDELLDDQAWTIVEWADRVAGLMPAKTLWIEIDCGDVAENRTLNFRTQCDHLGKMLKKLNA